MKGAFTPITTSDAPPTPPLGWSWRLLSDVARLESGHTPSRRVPDYWDNGTIPWLSLKDMRGLAGRYITDTVDKTTQAGIDNSSARILPAGTVAFCRTASVGDVVVLGRAMATSQDFANWVCGPALVPEYLYEALRASESEFDREKQGSTHKTIYMPVLERFRVLLPPVDEQRRIADILDKADALRRKRKEVIALTDDLLRSTFLEMFGDPVTNPKGWPSETIEVICSRGGHLVDGPFGSSLKPEHYVETGAKVVRNWNIYDDRFDAAEFRHITFEKFDELRRSDVVEGDVLITTKGTVGDVCVAPNLSGPAVLSASGTVRLRLPPDGEYIPEFVVAQMTNLHYKDYIHSFEAGSAQQYLNLSAIRKMRLIRPPADEQRVYSQFRRLLRSSIERMTDSMSEFENLFSSLTSQAFSVGFAC